MTDGKMYVLKNDFIGDPVILLCHGSNYATVHDPKSGSTFVTNCCRLESLVNVFYFRKVILKKPKKKMKTNQILTLPKLGKLEPRHDARTLKFSSYVDRAILPAPKSSFSWLSDRIKSLGMMKNDLYGDCTCAAIGHMIMEWAAANGITVSFTDAQVLAVYKAVTGFKTSDPSTDRGANMLDILNYMRRHGMAGHKIDSFMQIDPKNVDHVKLAIEIFGGIYTGAGLPVTAQKQTVWDVVRGKGTAINSWGGHCIPNVAYDAKTLTCITWGAEKEMTWSFFEKYVDECYAVISPDFFKAGKTPEGFDIEKLRADMSVL